jgi:hypothetical protein
MREERHSVGNGGVGLPKALAGGRDPSTGSGKPSSAAIAAALPGRRGCEPGLALDGLA